VKWKRVGGENIAALVLLKDGVRGSGSPTTMRAGALRGKPLPRRGRGSLVAGVKHEAKSFFGIFFLFALCSYVAFGADARSVPDQRDAQVLQALANRILEDPNFDMTRVPTNSGIVALHFRTPTKTGFLMPHQIRADIGRRTLPSDAERDLQKRNTPPDAKPDTYDAVTALFTNLTFATNIVVADLTDQMGGLNYGKFQKAHPNARGWMMAYLPGYSKDGTQAIVRAAVGPWPHGASITALLKKNADKWIVKWHYIAYYA
jgi:hypothetical protein